MAVSIPRAFVEFVLLGPTTDRRQLQDSPILGDVWLAYAATPDKAIEVLITPDRNHSAGEVAIALDDVITRGDDEPGADVSPLQGIIAASLKFEEVLQYVIPMTVWWKTKEVDARLLKLPKKRTKKMEGDPFRLQRVIDAILSLATSWNNQFAGALGKELIPSLDRFMALAGLILWAGAKESAELDAAADPESAWKKALADVDTSKSQIADIILNLLDRIHTDAKTSGMVYQVSLNRAAMAALTRSVPAVKADAARTLFSVDCSEIAWAVIDSGIQADHEAFQGKDGKSRVKKSYDFSNIRKIVSLDNLKDNEARKERLKVILHDDLVAKPDEDEAIRRLTQLASDARQRKSIDWDLVTPFVQINGTTRPATSDHGTHVAGILGARKAEVVKKKTRKSAKTEDEDDATAELADERVNGICPDIQLYDFRVLAPNVRETEFAIIAALQYIRYLNGRTDHTTIHGANLSLSIPHDVRNYACGHTPICLECERLVDSGVVVVAAAGNLGYQTYTTREGSYDGYAAFSITDPGNAESVITVGATHRYAPHTYGVSFFSSRGPTGDGRPKPDLVAPGEKIHAPFREGWGDLDGTSMAAPHVSGAAAMLLARYSELIGEPLRVKKLLCDNATDLQRERSFQGNGMLDVLRTFQGI